MRAVYGLCCALLFNLARAQYCYQDAHNSCSFPDQKMTNCHAKYSAAENEVPNLHSYVQQHLEHSFQYLLMTTNFATYESSRDGFAKLFRKLSDSTWDDAIDLIKYITKRGGIMDFEAKAPNEPNPAFTQNYNMFELESLSRALDMYKTLATQSHRIHSDATRRSAEYHDAEMLSYIENKFVHEHAERIREIAGHANDLSSMLLKGSDQSLALFMFDEFLQKNIP